MSDERRGIPKISFIIPVRDDAVRLRHCLSTILANRYPPSCLEIVVVDNGSRDESVCVAKDAGASVLVVPGISVSGLRNRGAAAASGEIFAFIDADHEIVANWAEIAAELLSQDEQVAAVGALCAAPRDGTWVQRSYDLLRRRPSERRDVEWLGTGNMAVRRRAFEAVGGFDVGLQTCEDVDLCRRLRTRGFRIVEDPRLRNVHFGDPATLAALFWGELWRGRDNLRASLKGRVTLREVPSIAMPVANLALLGIGLAGVATLSGTGLLWAGFGFGGVLCGAAARALRMMSHSTRFTVLGSAQAMAVAMAYDVARALALVRGGSHATRSRGR